MTVMERVRASRGVEKARLNTAYADRIGLSYSLATKTQLGSGVMQAFLTPHAEKTDKTANNAKSQKRKGERKNEKVWKKSHWLSLAQLLPSTCLC